MVELPDRIDFLIVGAGPAGTATALSLLERGVPGPRILIIDRQTLPRSKLCGGGLTGRAWERLDRWGVELDRVWDARCIHLTVDDLGQHLLEPRRLATVDRLELDYRMLRRARASGVQFYAADFLDQQLAHDGWLVSTSEGKIACAYLIGADGCGSRVRRNLGLAARKAGILLEVCLDSAGSPDAALEMDFSPALEGIAGYLWTFPFYDSAQGGQLRVKYGIMDRSGRASSGHLRSVLQRYVDSKEGRATCLPTIVPGYPERYWRPFERSAVSRALVVGDAWGVDPLLGEGIAVAFEQAEYAASQLVRAWRKGGRISPCYDLAYPFSSTGWNLWFLKKLGDFVYGRYGRFWLGILTEDRSLARLSHTPRFGGYGRFARHPLQLTAIAIRRLLALLSPFRSGQ